MLINYSQGEDQYKLKFCSQPKLWISGCMCVCEYVLAHVHQCVVLNEFSQFFCSLNSFSYIFLVHSMCSVNIC